MLIKTKIKTKIKTNRTINTNKTIGNVLAMFLIKIKSNSNFFFFCIKFLLETSYFIKLNV